ncbi:MAG: radical SAM protein, partial [Actinobacteria bacterium]|nr:radical SAM protein [Actinomycetota bacterium]
YHHIKGRKMTLKERVKLYTTKTAIKGALKVLPKISDEKWVSLVKGRVYRMKKKEERDFLENLLVNLKRAASKMSPMVREKVVMNLINNAMVQGQPKRMAFAKKYGFNPPNLLVMSPSMKCNLRCYGCYAWQYSKSNDLPYDVCNRVIDEANDIGLYFFVITGGEPFYWDRFFDFLERHNDSFFQVYTNGQLIDDEVAERLAKLGNALPCISVEGFEKETEARRGKGTWKKIMDAMDALERHGVLFGFSVTATRENNELVVSDEFIDLFVSKGAFIGWYFNYIPIGREPNLDLMPTPEQRNYRRERILEIRRTKNIIVADFWNDGPLVHGCMAGGKNYLHINVNGDVEPCVFVHFAADNIKEKSLVDILTSDFFMAFKKRQPYTENHLRPCTIIDNPHVLRDIVAETGAYPTHDGAETIIGCLARPLDEYAEKYASIVDPIWEKEYKPAEEKEKAV